MMSDDEIDNMTDAELEEKFGISEAKLKAMKSEDIVKRINKLSKSNKKGFDNNHDRFWFAFFTHRSRGTRISRIIKINKVQFLR